MIYDHNIQTVDLVSDLTALAPVDGQICNTLGYSLVGLGANLYRYEAGSSAVCDGGFILDGVGGNNAVAETSSSYAGTGTGRWVAVDQSVADALEFGCDADGVSDDTYRLQAMVNACASSNKEARIPSGVYINEIIASADIVITGGGAFLDVASQDEPAILSNDDGAAHSRSSISDFKVSQPASSDPGGGTANNHSSIKLLGAIGSVISNIRVEDAMGGVSIGYGSVGLSDRASSGNVVTGVAVQDAEKLGLELVGAQQTAVAGYSVHGNEGVSSSFRITGGGSTALSKTNAIAGATTTDFNVGLSLQNGAQNNNISFAGDNVNILSQVLVPTLLAEAARNNMVTVTGDTIAECGLYVEEGDHNVFNFALSGIVVGGSYDAAVMEVSGPTINPNGHNSYSGLIDGVTGSGLSVYYPHPHLDVTVSGCSALGVHVRDTAHFATGRISVNSCQNGVYIRANNCNLNISAHNISFSEVYVFGDSNTLNINTDGEVTVSGDNNHISGVMDAITLIVGADNNNVHAKNATITDAGTGNTVAA